MPQAFPTGKKYGEKWSFPYSTVGEIDYQPHIIIIRLILWGIVLFRHIFYATLGSIVEQMMDCKKGFSTTELSVIIFLIALFFVAGAIFLKITSKSAYDITARHDLELFAEYQQFYYKINGRCIGEQGQSLRNDGLESDLAIDNYTLSDGVSITIISGDPENPHDRYNPYTFQGRHVKSNTVFGYNFRTKTITER